MKTLAMTEKEIRILMILSNVRQSDIAAKLGVTSSAINQVLTGMRTTPRIRQAIAEAVGRPIGQIWPPEEDEAKQANNSKNESEEQEKNIVVDHEQKVSRETGERQ